MTAAADAYQHAADLTADIAAQARQRQLTIRGPVFVRVEYVEKLADELAKRAEQARRSEVPT